MYIKERILQIAEYKGIGKVEFCEKIGLTYGNFTGSNKKTPINSNTLGNILSIFSEISPEWLLTGEGEMLRNGEKSLKIDNILATADANTLPLIPFEAVAGWNDIDVPGVRRDECLQYYVPEFREAGAEFLVRVSGDSMFPRYASGDILACRRIQEVTFFQWGKVYVIDSLQGPMVKRIMPSPDTPDHITCLSDNPQYPPFTLPKSEIRSLSIVVGIIRVE